ncbi:hypothetical protein [Paracoccus alkanivorans]|uniref:Transposase n=1 Tax=Paracoccus alkanivorans TaxID=2116655 RepID=A0A3M0M8J7_9RHOB|nr:hypothetical protein [Paracoccus alkanivorans]RMC33725.1 hypothetical protein C9E81_15575 [Paracoccus alkanivorans]
MEHHEQDDEQVFPGNTRACGSQVLGNAERHESRRAAILLVSAKIDCAPQTLIEWVKKAEMALGEQAGVTNEIFRKASAYFSQAELDRRPKS